MYTVTRIEETKEEAFNVKTIRFKFENTVYPGQFVMVWIPGIREIPMSLSYTGDLKGITFKVLGKGTEALSSLTDGSRIWVRGPYGKGYTKESGQFLAIAGGTGVSSLAPFLETAGEFDLLIGAKSKQDLYFIERLKRVSKNIYITTEDGSDGEKGLLTDLLPHILKKRQYNKIYACGPEKMIRAIMNMTELRISASLERYMKCGIGICDSCTINGYRVCVDGPVFEDQQLRNMTELGDYTREKSGLKVRL
jgi:dihydroorotate dehydrogenase electron transfer subunit